MARVVAFVPDLLFGSKVLELLRAGGHEVALAGSPDALERSLPGADALVLDLTADAEDRVRFAGGAAHTAGVPVLAFYSHVEGDVRSLAERAGCELVVPRSRMAREGAALVDRLVAGPRPGSPGADA